MPYRRLPNTDEARIRAMQKAIEKGNSDTIQDRVISFETLGEARVLLNRFKEIQGIYKQSLQTQSHSNIKYQNLVKNAKLYISHFIQVLNLSVIRNEIKGEQKVLYGLNPDDFSIPDILSDTAVLEWGEKIITGEHERIKQGGAPIYNPTIAKVKVHYDMFREAYLAQRIYRKNTSRSLENLSEHREPIDKIISDIWNQVEDRFKELEGEIRLNKCREYGIVYYYRRGETPE